MSIPKPGQPVRGSTSGAPLMAAFDLLGRRWAMGIIWQLHNGPATFRTLQAACESISPSILNSRIKDLRAAGLLERTLEGYRLTSLGQELFALLQPFAEWSLQWAAQIAPQHEARWNQLREKK